MRFTFLALSSRSIGPFGGFLIFGCDHNAIMIERIFYYHTRRMSSKEYALRKPRNIKGLWVPAHKSCSLDFD
jgi:hypothetical protein